MKLLSKQVDDGVELRKQLSESVNDLQRQLKNEREENKKAKKRYAYHIPLCTALILILLPFLSGAIFPFIHVEFVSSLILFFFLFLLFLLSVFRIQLLEVETKRSGNRRGSDAEAGQGADTLDSLTQEIISLKKDIQTAERIAKQSEVEIENYIGS